VRTEPAADGVGKWVSTEVTTGGLGKWVSTQATTRGVGKWGGIDAHRASVASQKLVTTVPPSHRSLRPEQKN
jgi:hypothetical protein